MGVLVDEIIILMLEMSCARWHVILLTYEIP